MLRASVLSLNLLASIFPTDAFFTVTCPRIVRDRLDPIVSPGAVSGHVHSIVGGSAFAATYIYEDTLAAKCTSCPVKEDLSNYWTPQLYVKLKDGTFRMVPQPDGDGGGMTIYYIGFDDTHPVEPFPPGFGMLGGDASLRSYTGSQSAKGLTFWCKGGVESDYFGLPTEHCPSGIRVQFHMPNCWNGVDIIPPTDGRQHVSYMVGDVRAGACPHEFPHRLPQLFYEVNYDTQQFKDEWAGNGSGNGTQEGQPFTFAQGDGTGYGFHGDFVNGWNATTLEKIVTTCHNAAFNAQDCTGNNFAPYITQNTDAEMEKCKISATIDEDIVGPVKRLPGCNKVTYGPGRAAAVKDCDDKGTFVGSGGGSVSSRVVASLPSNTTASVMTTSRGTAKASVF